MKNLLLILILTCKMNFAFAQGLSQDSIYYYIKNLNWESLFLKINYGTELALTKDAEKLVTFKNDATVKKLFCALSERTKTVVVHVILSRMFEPENSKFATDNVYKNDSIIAVNYSCNTLRWQYQNKEGKYIIEPQEIKKIKTYWQNKLPVLKNMSKAAKRKQSKKCSRALNQGL